MILLLRRIFVTDLWSSAEFRQKQEYGRTKFFDSLFDDSRFFLQLCRINRDGISYISAHKRKKTTMLLGTTTFKCNECGERFTGITAEMYATAYIAPQQCPKCNSMHTYPAHLFLLGPIIYRTIWKHLDNDKKKN